MQKQGFPRRGKKESYCRGQNHLEQNTSQSTHIQESQKPVIQAGVEMTETINTSLTKGKEKIPQEV